MTTQHDGARSLTAGQASKQDSTIRLNLEVLDGNTFVCQVVAEKVGCSFLVPRRVGGVIVHESVRQRNNCFLVDVRPVRPHLICPPPRGCLPKIGPFSGYLFVCALVAVRAAIHGRGMLSEASEEEDTAFLEVAHLAGTLASLVLAL